MVFVGAGGNVGGTALYATGVGAPAGAAVNVGSTALMIRGGIITANSSTRFVQSTSELTEHAIQYAKSAGPKVKSQVQTAWSKAKNFFGGGNNKKPKKPGKDNRTEGNGNRVGNFAGKINADNIPNMTKNDILEGLPSNWKYTENNGFVHIRDANGNVRMKIDPPDKVTKYDHDHIFDESGNPIDVNLNVVDRKSPDAHIPYKK
ncbi:hypothetical protein KO561_00980 [Radiobacillus kanasensis]|uniref:hypothetical protein n=1 Tax=Radiobacillus kanasensis TaxID=2844358 RepID=UPI001E5EDAFD|nr:hypothetical protein [Radiobacillus kanasensis]UFT99584.1 hypothetical protein KO561_00980 [Radiobacillus kanasensis]